MKNYSMTLLLAVIGILFPFIGFCEEPTTKAEWFGSWNMNHDGFEGRLTIAEIKADCATSAWCDMTISYVNSKGERISGSISRIDNNWQHMIFYLSFPGNTQRFDAYLFSWDKQKLAGTTYWNNQTFGFYASKQMMKVNPIVNINKDAASAVKPGKTSASSSNEDVIISKKILSGDTIETRYADGRIRWRTRNGWIDKFPDGRESRVSFAQTPEFTPPTAISDQNVILWLNSIQNTLLDMIKEELLNDQVSINGIVSKERNSQMNTYQVINNRFYFLNYLNNLK